MHYQKSQGVGFNLITVHNPSYKMTLALSHWTTCHIIFMPCCAGVCPGVPLSSAVPLYLYPTFLPLYIQYLCSVVKIKYKSKIKLNMLSSSNAASAPQCGICPQRRESCLPTGCSHRIAPPCRRPGEWSSQWHHHTIVLLQLPYVFYSARPTAARRGQRQRWLFLYIVEKITLACYSVYRSDRDIYGPYIYGV